MKVTDLTKKNAQIVDINGHTLAFGEFKARGGLCKVKNAKFKVSSIRLVENKKTYNKIKISEVD